jgi:hypothetical protein
VRRLERVLDRAQLERLDGAALVVRRGEHRVVAQAGEEQALALHTALAMLVRIEVARRSRQNGEERRLRPAQIARAHPEVRLRRGRRPDEVAAVVEAVEVRLEDLSLVELLLEVLRARRLAQLHAGGPLRRLGSPARVEQLHQLLGDRARARHHLERAQVLPQRAQDRRRIDAAVLEEAPILGGERAHHQAIADLLERHGAPAHADLRRHLAEE